MMPDDRAVYLHAVTHKGATDDVILPLPDAPGTGDRTATIRRWYAVAGEPFNKESMGSKGTAEDYRQALKAKWGVESFNDVDLGAIENSIRAMKSLDLKARHIEMVRMIKEVASIGEGE
jgi:hypothetical protein